MQSIQRCFSTLTSSFLRPSPVTREYNSVRSFVKNFWEKNNDSKNMLPHKKSSRKVNGVGISNNAVSELINCC